MLQVIYINSTPIDSKEIWIATINDPLLSQVLGFVNHGWPNLCPSEDLKPFYLRSTELTSEDHVILWGLRVIVPTKIRSSVLNLLHDTHIGVVRMNGLARFRVWWPGIDTDIEQMCTQCVECSQHSKDPPKSTLSVLDFPSKPWQRLHIEYACPFFGSMWLVWIEAFSKYGGVEKVKSANGFSTILKLTKVFSIFGNPEQIVYDNGAPLTFHKFKAFCISNGIRHIRSASYHPSTNGEAKRFVQVFNKAWRRQVGNKIDVQAETFRFLQQYQTIPHLTTERSPSEQQFGRTIRTTLNLLKPQVKTQVLKQHTRAIQNHDRTARERQIAVGQPVFARQYLKPRKWVGGVTSTRTKPLSYVVQVGDQISSTNQSQLFPNQENHQDLSNLQLEQLYDDAEVRPEPEPNYRLLSLKRNYRKHIR